MTIPLNFRPAAEAEFVEATAWYERQQPGLGNDFIAEVEQVLDRIAEHPARYPISEGTVREAPVARFPYCIYYRAKIDHVVVVAVFHTSRNPADWQKRR